VREISGTSEGAAAVEFAATILDGNALPRRDVIQGLALPCALTYEFLLSDAEVRTLIDDGLRLIGSQRELLVRLDAWVPVSDPETDRGPAMVASGQGMWRVDYPVAPRIYEATVEDGWFEEFAHRTDEPWVYVFGSLVPTPHFIYSHRANEWAVIAGPRSFLELLCRGDLEMEVKDREWMQRGLWEDPPTKGPWIESLSFDFFHLNDWLIEPAWERGSDPWNGAHS